MAMHVSQKDRFQTIQRIIGKFILFFDIAFKGNNRYPYNPLFFNWLRDYGYSKIWKFSSEKMMLFFFTKQNDT